MFAFVSEIPSRVRNVLSRFRRFFATRPQYDNFCRAVLGMIVAGKKEHDVKSINELFIDTKDQSSLNRFFTESRWRAEDVVREGNELLISEERHGTEPRLRHLPLREHRGIFSGRTEALRQ